MYLLGQPAFDLDPRDSFSIPLGQWDLATRVLRETADPQKILLQLRMEYCAIAYALKKMAVDFRIVYANEDRIDKPALQACIEKIGCRLIGYHKQPMHPAYACFPRDLYVTLGKAVLISPVMRVINPEKGGYHFMVSRLGEGGRVLATGENVLVCINLDDLPEAEANEHRQLLEQLEQRGLKVSFLPYVITEGADSSGQKNRGAFSNCHLDRYASLLVGEDGALHLIVDPLVQTSWTEPPHRIFGSAESCHWLAKKCGSLGIGFHQAPELRVPYSLNLQQFPDGRVLMTSGEPLLEELVRMIVGDRQVFTTEIPIRYYPVYTYGSIRCLIGEIPECLTVKTET